MNVEQGWIERFEAFVRSKPADEEYDFRDVFECPVGQFGREISAMPPGHSFGESDAMFDLHVQAHGQLFSKPWTFGALADRLAAIVKQEPGK